MTFDDADRCRVTFTWAEDDPRHPAREVLLRLLTATDFAYEDGDLSDFLFERSDDGVWRCEVTLSSAVRASYQFCVVRDRTLRGRLPAEDEFRQILSAPILDPANPLTIGPSTWPANAGASIIELPDAPPQPWHARRPGVPRGTVARHEAAGSTFWTHVPAVPADHYALAVLFDGDTWMTIDGVSTLDNL
ncbi:MAG: DUF3327 domain-containing protein, partial [Catenulispora sp.]|nr:DUF3327 domain-containing protein [Catenulispora sp.]